MENQVIEIEKVQETALTWPERAKQLAVVDEPTYKNAVDVLKDIAGLKKQINDHHKPMIESAHATHKATIEARDRFLKPLDVANEIIRKSVSEWTAEQQRLQAKAQREAQEKARKEAEERQLAEAEKAEAENKPEVAEAIISKPVEVAPVKVEPIFQKAAGTTTVTTWKAEVVDLKALCAAIGEGKVSTDAIQANMTYLNGLARTMKESMAIPGVKAISEQSVRIG